MLFRSGSDTACQAPLAAHCIRLHRRRRRKRNLPGAKLEVIRHITAGTAPSGEDTSSAPPFQRGPPPGREFKRAEMVGGELGLLAAGIARKHQWKPGQASPACFVQLAQYHAAPGWPCLGLTESAQSAITAKIQIFGNWRPSHGVPKPCKRWRLCA